MPDGRYAIGKVHLPEPGDSPDLSHLRPSERDLAASRKHTMPGVGQFDCPRRDSCQLEFTRDIIEAIKPLQVEIAELRSVVLKAMTARGITGSDTPSGSPKAGNIDVALGPVKVKGRMWPILMMIGFIVIGAGTAWVLAAWGPTGCAKSTKTNQTK